MPNQYTYPILRSTSNVDGTPIQQMLDEMPEKPFRTISKRGSADGLAVAICCLQDHRWEDHFEMTPRLEEFVFTIDDIPPYLSLGCENSSHEYVKDLKKSQEWRGVE